MVAGTSAVKFTHFLSPKLSGEGLGVNGGPQPVLELQPNLQQHEPDVPASGEQSPRPRPPPWPGPLSSKAQQ